MKARSRGAQSRPSPSDGQTVTRSHLIEAVCRFVQSASVLSGVGRIVLVGSLTTAKLEPKDADLIVTIADDMDLTELARLSRRLKGTAQRINRGADVFLANERGQYIGRICHWKDCRPGIRMSCDARNRGLRHYLHDDLDDVCLTPELINNPPVDLWPEVIQRQSVPSDIEEQLIPVCHCLGKR